MSERGKNLSVDVFDCFVCIPREILWMDRISKPSQLVNHHSVIYARLALGRYNNHLQLLVASG